MELNELLKSNGIRRVDEINAFLPKKLVAKTVFDIEQDKNYLISVKAVIADINLSCYIDTHCELFDINHFGDLNKEFDFDIHHRSQYLIIRKIDDKICLKIFDDCNYKWKKDYYIHEYFDFATDDKYIKVYDIQLIHEYIPQNI